MKCANEKVLGFKKKDGSISVYHHARKGWMRYWVTDEPQMIPVVSIEWLKEYCKRYKQYNIAAKELMWKEDLLDAAKKESEKP